VLYLELVLLRHRVVKEVIDLVEEDEGRAVGDLEVHVDHGVDAADARLQLLVRIDDVVDRGAKLVR